MEDNEIQDFAALLSDNENGPGIKVRLTVNETCKLLLVYSYYYHIFY